MTITNERQKLQAGQEKEALLHRMNNRIRKSLELQEILTATVEEICTFLNTDRVMVYRFNSDGSGKVIAESIVENRLLSLLNLNFPADDIPANVHEQLKTRRYSIVHVDSQQTAISTFFSSEDTEIHYRASEPCHIQYLQAMGVQFSLTIPILQQERVWGLLVAHHSQPYSIANQELELIQLVVEQISIAIAQSTTLSITRIQAEREAALNKVSTLLHSHINPPLSLALEEIVAVVEAAGGRLYIKNKNKNLSPEIYSYGEPLNITKQGEIDFEFALAHLHLVRTGKGERQNLTSTVSDGSNSILIISDIYHEPNLQPWEATFRNAKIRSLLSVPLQYNQEFIGYLTIFAKEINTEIWWAGEFETSQQQVQPRQSFQAWKQEKNGQAREWTNIETDLIQALGDRLSMAIHQHQLYQQIHILNTNLETQVQERTNELQRSLDLARVLNHVTDQIRSTLDLSTVLQTIVREVRKLLNTDRVVVYKFLNAWKGQVIVEDVREKSLSILEEAYEDNCFPLEYTFQYQLGRLKAVNNVQESSLQDCHKEFLKSIQVRANLVVPICMGDKLWGLLIAHECYQPRTWQGYELDLLKQLADQAAIALRQAELFEDIKVAATTALEKANQLEFALGNLQKAQTRLIQSEKMSSLGQLVAGIAHEINNPVNFIYGNIKYVNEYVENLSELVSYYQEDCANPSQRILEYVNDIDLEYLLEDLPKMLTSMQVGADRIRNLVLSLRNFSRLDESDRKPVNIHEGIENTLLILQNRLKAKNNPSGIEIIKNYGELPLVECFAGQLNQVFMNIISNALDALEQRDSERSPQDVKNSPSEITISTSLGDGIKEIALPNGHNSTFNSSIKIKISDNGPGIPEEVRTQIFNPFFTTKPVGKGTGLGLSISYQIIVEKHGGTLKCNSSPGQGTEFLIEIPFNN